MVKSQLLNISEFRLGGNGTINFNITEEKLYINNKPLELKNFLFKQELGHGANAYAFLIYNSKLAREEVLKIWIPRQNGNKVDINRFLAEVRKNARFTHQGIASIYEADIIENLFYCRMQYIKGTTLKKYLKNDRLFVFRYQYLKQILHILKDVYDAGYFHGDIHSKNIIIDSTESLYKNRHMYGLLGQHPHL